MKILVATEKPFATSAVDGIRAIVEAVGYELVLLENYTDVSQFNEAIADADGLIVRSDKVTADVLSHASKLKIVVRAGAGYDNLDLAACSEKGVVAMNTPGQNSNAVAELAIDMMLFMARNNFQPGTGTELKGKTLGIQAYGHVGCLVAHLAKGFGMEVLVFDPFVSIDKMAVEGVTPIADLKELYRRSNYLSLHVPANNETKLSVNYELLHLLPKGACVVNTARKEVINEADLMRVMEERPDIKYISDIAPDSLAILQEKCGSRVFATAKKIGAETTEANVNAGLAAANQLVAFLKDGIDHFRLN